MSIKYTADAQMKLDHISELLESLQTIAADNRIHYLNLLRRRKYHEKNRRDKNIKNKYD